MQTQGKRIDIICGACGSKNVSRDAWADWDVHTQQWVLGAVFDYGHCHDCDGESRLEEVPLFSRHDNSGDDNSGDTIPN